MIDFSLSEDLRDIQARARKFAQEEILPIAAEYDRKAEVPPGIVQKAKAAGLPWTEAKGRDGFAPLSRFVPAAAVADPDRPIGALGLAPASAAPAASPPTAVPDPTLAAYLAGTTDLLPSEIRDITIGGTPDEVQVQLKGYVAAGIAHFMLWFRDAPDDAGMHLFAERVLPRFRQIRAT